MKNLYIFLAHIDDLECATIGYLSKNYKSYDKIHVVIATYWKEKAGIFEENLRLLNEKFESKIVYTNLLNKQRQMMSSIDFVKDQFYKLLDFKTSFDILTHDENDAHTDHRAVSMISMGMVKYANTYVTVYSPSTYNFQPNLFISMNEDEFKIKKACLDKYNISNEQSYTGLGYYLQSDDHYNIGEAYFLESYANKHKTKYAEVYRILKMSLV